MIILEFLFSLAVALAGFTYFRKCRNASKRNSEKMSWTAWAALFAASAGLLYFIYIVLTIAFWVMVGGHWKSLIKF